MMMMMELVNTLGPLAPHILATLCTIRPRSILSPAPEVFSTSRGAPQGSTLGHWHVRTYSRTLNIFDSKNKRTVYMYGNDRRSQNLSAKPLIYKKFNLL